MGRALETVVAYGVEATTTAGMYYSLTPHTAQSFAIRASDGVPSASILAPWGQFGGAGFLQVKSPRLHDTTIADTMLVKVDTDPFCQKPLWDLDADEPGYSTDVLTVQFSTIASLTTSTKYSVGLPIYYPSVSGVDQAMITPQQLASYNDPNSKVGDHYISWVTPDSASTAGDIGTGVAINSINDQFYADGAYALLGYLCNDSLATVVITGTDTGNLFVGGPGSQDADLTRSWFVNLSRAQNLPLIPVIKANNRNNTFVSVATGADTSTQHVVGLIWCYLGKASGTIG
jgi:hypothetical protein